MKLAARISIVLMLLSSAAADAQQRLVLIAAADSPIESLSAFEVRKVFLGIDVQKAGGFVRPLRNTSDAALEQIFLQSVIGLTKKNYERRLLNNLLRIGAVRPEEFDTKETLTDALTNDKFAVTYAVDDGQLGDVKVLRVLWEQ